MAASLAAVFRVSSSIHGSSKKLSVNWIKYGLALEIGNSEEVLLDATKDTQRDLNCSN
jgi:hypothetical protein